MDKNIKILLDNINIDENSYQYFNDAKITKIKVNSKNNSWNIFITKDELLPVEIYEELEAKKMTLDPKACKIEFIFDIKNPNLEKYLSYYKYLLKLLKDDLKVLELYENSMQIEDDFLVLVATNEVEEEHLTKCLPKISEFYKKLDYNLNIEIKLNHENNILEEIQNDLANTVMPEKKEVSKPVEHEKKTYHREPKDPNSVIGRGIKEEPIKIKALIGEDNDVVVEGKIFGVEYFESTKTDFKIITLKITDFSDSIYCKVFVRDSDEYARLCKEFKAGNWYKFRGYTKNDQY